MKGEGNSHLFKSQMATTPSLSLETATLNALDRDIAVTADL